MLSKLSTEINKPNGQFLMKSDKAVILDFLGKLPVRKIPGIGNCAEQILHGIGVKTCQDILNNLVDIYIGFTENSFDFFLRSALGISRCYHELAEERKSVSVSRTFTVISKV
jgi:DNA polymerase kappa